MKRSKRHIVKKELPETSTSKSEKEHDLAYYIRDRVELMHQVFSVLKQKELRAMAPECVRHISINDLQELCMEELLGISSKRLCAILDGATPPSDTESSTESEQLETISLDSISSDEEILTQVSSKKSKKHKHRSKTKKKSRTSGDEDREQADRSRRAGLTVLELLELQARARAIRAQLQQEQASAVSTGPPTESVPGNTTDDEVEIKEEAAEVVEISSEDEKPNVKELEERVNATQKETLESNSNAATVTKKVNDLIITVPKSNTSRRIKLKRNTSSNSKANEKALNDDKNNAKSNGSNSVVTVVINKESNDKSIRLERVNQIGSTGTNEKEKVQGNKNLEKPKEAAVRRKEKVKSKDRKKKRKKDVPKDKDGSDHDEITLQLSDTEKMDLLEDLEGKKPEKVDDSEDSSSDSSDEESIKAENEVKETEDENKKGQGLDSKHVDVEIEENNASKKMENNSNEIEIKQVDSPKNESRSDLVEATNLVEDSIVNKSDGSPKISENDNEEHEGEENTQTSKKHVLVLEDETQSDPTQKEVIADTKPSDRSVVNNTQLTSLEEEPIHNVAIGNKNTKTTQEQINIGPDNQKTEVNEDISSHTIQEENNVESNVVNKEINDVNSEPSSIDKLANDTISIESSNKNQLEEKSDGELSDRDSSEVEASDFKPDVVCISDDDEQSKKKKKKKDKKNKKDKKSMKKKDFRESGDQNFYTETDAKCINEPVNLDEEVILIPEVTEVNNSISSQSMVTEDNNAIIIPENETEPVKEFNNVQTGNQKSEADFDEEIYEILSDDSSCYEVEDISISKEPTAEEIEALSAKVDEIERDRSVDSNTQDDNDSEDVEKVSWKDRYLQSSKVKKVLTTANILNAMRKKNLSLKKKLKDAQKDENIEEQAKIKQDKLEEVKVPSEVEDGSIEQYKTLDSSTKYVDPVKELDVNTTDNKPENENGITDQEADDRNGTDRGDKRKRVSNEMKHEAKQLLRMYKMLLKYNDMTKKKDPSKKKKKKKKSKDKDKSVASQSSALT